MQWFVKVKIGESFEQLKDYCTGHWKGWKWCLNSIERVLNLSRYWKCIERVLKRYLKVLKMYQRWNQRHWKGTLKGIERVSTKGIGKVLKEYWKGIERTLEMYWKGCAEKVWTIKCSFRISIKQVWSENKLNLRKLVKMYIDWICIHKESTQSQTNVKGIS